ncbi:MAG: hypothetical protein Q9195_009028 [Heterodermia aff. obscurata]
MQEHIRRAHPEHYIAKLPATEESFQLMINTPPSERPPPPPSHPSEPPAPAPASTRILEDAYPAAATAAVALAQLHNHRPDSDWESDAVCIPDILIVNYGADCELVEQDPLSEGEALRRPRMHSSVELPPIHNHMNQEPISPFHSPRPRELLPSIMSRSPPGRSSTLPPIQKRDKPARPRKSSITKNNRRPKHERSMSKEYARRLSIEGRKAFSAEPASAMGKRWEDLIEAATSANEADSDRDLTPVS